MKTSKKTANKKYTWNYKGVKPFLNTEMLIKIDWGEKK